MSDPRKVPDKVKEKEFKERKEIKELKEKELKEKDKDLKDLKEKEKEKENKEGLKELKEKEIKEIKEFKERKEKEVKEFKDIKENKENKEFKEFEGPIDIEQPLVFPEAALAGAGAPEELRAKIPEKIKPEKEFEKIKPEKEIKELEKIKPEKELEKIKPEKEKSEKEIFEGPGDLTIEDRLTRIESAITQIAHFIQADLRPDLGQSALKSEPDAGAKPASGTEGSGGKGTGRKRG